MCRVHVQYCYDCKIFSPILLLQPLEVSSNYYIVIDSVCRNYYCIKSKLVNSLELPSTADQWNTCESCKLDDCFVKVIYRNCTMHQGQTRSNKRWLTRKMVGEEWTRHYKLIDLC